jgi:hypothetical protein
MRRVSSHRGSNQQDIPNPNIVAKIVSSAHLQSVVPAGVTGKEKMAAHPVQPHAMVADLHSKLSASPARKLIDEVLSRLSVVRKRHVQPADSRASADLAEAVFGLCRMAEWR